MLNKRKWGVMLFLLLSNLLFIFHYMCLGALTGAATLFVDEIYLIVIFIFEKKEWHKYNKYLCIVAMVATIMLTMLTWENALSLLPMFSMLIYYVTMMFPSVVGVKLGTFIRTATNVIYMAIIASYIGAVLEAIMMIWSIIGIIVSWKHSKKAYLSTIKTSKALLIK